MELLKDFDIQKYLDKKPPSNNSFTTKQEIKALLFINDLRLPQLVTGKGLFFCLYAILKITH